MISTLSLDYLHLVLSRVLKSMFDFWLHVIQVNPNHLLPSSFEKLNVRIVSFQAYIPCNFLRLCRHVDKVELRKAAEFRMFLLYIGTVSLRGLLPGDAYECFLALSASLYIFLTHFVLKFNNFWTPLVPSSVQAFLVFMARG